MKIGDPQTGVPPKPGVYVVEFRGEPLDEVFSYFDGKSWTTGADDPITALSGCSIGDRIPFFRRKWWKQIMYWREVTRDPKAVVRALGGT